MGIYSKSVWHTTVTAHPTPSTSAPPVSRLISHRRRTCWSLVASSTHSSVSPRRMRRPPPPSLCKMHEPPRCAPPRPPSSPTELHEQSRFTPPPLRSSVVVMPSSRPPPLPPKRPRPCSTVPPRPPAALRKPATLRLLLLRPRPRTLARPRLP